MKQHFYELSFTIEGADLFACLRDWSKASLLKQDKLYYICFSWVKYSVKILLHGKQR
jgi:hypothetical protein